MNHISERDDFDTKYKPRPFVQSKENSSTLSQGKIDVEENEIPGK